MGEDPIKMVESLTEYVDELIVAKKQNKDNKIKGRTQMILIVLDKLREAHKATSLPSALILQIQKEKMRADLDGSFEVIFNKCNCSEFLKDSLISDNHMERKAAILQHFNKYEVSSLGHMTHQNNIEDICRYGILSYHDAHWMKPELIDISDPSVQHWREKIEPIYHCSIHAYAPLYINPRNPMLYKLKNLQNQIVMVEICPSVLESNRYLFTDGNAASKETEFYNSIDDLRYLPWDVLRSGKWNDIQDGKRKMCAEVLVYPKIPSSFIINIHCCSEDALSFINKCGKPVCQSKELYF